MALTKAQLSSIEAKTLQYLYADAKLTYLQSLVPPHISSTNGPFPDPKTLLLLTGTLFNLSDHFFRRSEIIMEGKKYNPGQLIHIVGPLNALSWDSLEMAGGSGSAGSNWNLSQRSQGSVDLPTERKAREMYSLINALIINARNVINERLQLVKQEYDDYIMNTKNDDNVKIFDWFKSENLKFNVLNLITKLSYTDIPQLPIQKQENIRSFYRHHHFQFLKEITIYFQNELILIKSRVTKLSISNHTTESCFSIYVELLRLADFYVIIRKFGRWIYFNHASYLTQFARGNRELKHAIGKMSILFGGNKQNGMLLTIIGKYSKRTEINQKQLKDSSSFFSESKRVALQMLDTLQELMNILQILNTEWDGILKDGKEHDFSTEKKRENVKRLIAADRERRASSINQMNQLNQQALRRSASLRVTPVKVSTKPSSRVGSRSGSLTATSNVSKKLIELRISSNDDGNNVSGTGDMSNNDDASNSSSNSTLNLNLLGSTEDKRKMSLTTGSKSPFVKSKADIGPSSNMSRSDSLQNSKLRVKQKIDSHLGSRNLKIEKINEDDITRDQQYRKPPVIFNDNITPSGTPGNSPEKTSNDDLLINNKAKDSSVDSSVTRTTSKSIRSPTNSKSNLPQSVISPSASRLGNISNNPTATAGAAASADSLRRRQSMYGGSSPVPKDNLTAAMRVQSSNEYSVGRSSPQALTAQQRLQQHIKRSQQNGSVYSKPLESRKIMRPKSMIVSKSEANNQLSKVNTLDLGLESPISVAVNSKTQELTNFPSSPLNSLTNSSHEAHNALNMIHTSRSRSRSNSNLVQISATKNNNNNHNSNNINENIKNGGVSSAVRSRAGSQGHTSNISTLEKESHVPSESSNSQSPHVTRTKSTFHSTQPRSRSESESLSTSSRSRSRSGSNSAKSRSRSGSQSTIGNLIIVSESEINGPLKLTDDGEVIKKVRFAGVPVYTEDEDAHTADRMRKQMRQKWATYKPLFRKLNSQEGLAFKTLRNGSEVEQNQYSQPGTGLAASSLIANTTMAGLIAVPPNEKGKVSMMGVINGHTTAIEAHGSSRRFSRIFGRR